MKNKTGVQEWAKHSFNFQKGCLNGCKYCYARRILKRFEPEVNFDEPEISLTKTAKALLNRKVGGVIMFPTMHDICSGNKNYYKEFLKILLKNDNKVLVVTKGNKEILEVIDYLLGCCPEKLNNLEIRVTIGSLKNEVLKHFEPNAPSVYERINVLKYAVCSGIENISISCEPMLDDSVTGLLQIAEGLNCEIWFGLANGYYEEGMPKITDDWVQWLIRISEVKSKVKLKDSLTGKRNKK